MKLDAGVMTGALERCPRASREMPAPCWEHPGFGWHFRCHEPGDGSAREGP